MKLNLTFRWKPLPASQGDIKHRSLSGITIGADDVGE